jgi:hydrogenase maturation protease
MSAAIKSIRIIGIGSPVSGDMIGIEAVQRLQQDELWRGRHDIDWVVLERPGAALLAKFAGVDTVCLLDALDHPQAGVQRIHPDALMAQSGNISSHDFGVAEALLLGARLGELPPHLLIYGLTSLRKHGEEEWYQQLNEMLVEDFSLP